MNIVTTKKWEDYLVGVFTEEWDVTTPAIVNKNDVVQFYLKVLSPLPDDFPKKTKNVTCYANLLTNWGFQDKRDHTNIERTEYLREFLRDNLVVFQAEQRNDFVIARDISLIPKSEEFSYTTVMRDVPIFQEYKKRQFERLGAQKTFLPTHHYFQHLKRDVNFVVVEETDGDLFVYGPIQYIEKKEEGIRFYSTKRMRCIPFKDAWLRYCTRFNDILYLSEDIYKEITKSLYEREGEVVLKEEIERSAIFSSLEMVDKEWAFLAKFDAITKKNRFYYDYKDLLNFHTSLKSSNLVILSGMSGTGKSKLVHMYAQALGIKEEQTLAIKVRPSWIDDSDLIGYLDVTTSRYYPGDSGLIQLLIDAERNQDKMYLVCFEEMNLGRVEHYFSQFLSILEGDERILTLYYSEGMHQEEIGYPPSIKIGKNVLFVGTVNIDESTYVFSDKVLDRANLITLNVMPFYELLKRNDEHIAIKEEEITSEMYQSFCNTGEEEVLNHRELSCLWEIHRLLQEFNPRLGVGWRIIHQINDYISQLPNQAYVSREMAFDIQVLQRILTKIRGAEAFLKDIVGQYNVQTGIVEQSELINILNRYDDISAFSLAKKGIVQKAKEIKINGFTI
ncbi:MAG: McrB family protein [Bacillaceae bacterium]